MTTAKLKSTKNNSLNIILTVPSPDLAYFYARMLSNYQVHVSGSFHEVLMELGDDVTEELATNVDNQMGAIYNYIEKSKQLKRTIKFYITVNDVNTAID